jgi:hypothetical protein
MILNLAASSRVHTTKVRSMWHKNLLGANKRLRVLYWQFAPAEVAMHGVIHACTMAEVRGTRRVGIASSSQ